MPKACALHQRLVVVNMTKTIIIARYLIGAFPLVAYVHTPLLRDMPDLIIIKYKPPFHDSIVVVKLHIVVVKLHIT